MNVMPETAAGKFEYKGKTYYFCNPRCLERFRANPEKFLGGTQMDHGPWTMVHGPSDAPLSPYTCPMHPEVRQLGPGVCPKCGMALEPEVVTLEEEENPELN